MDGRSRTRCTSRASCTADTGQPIYFEIDGQRMIVVRKGTRWTLHDELGHMGVSGEAWLVELEDGSYWWACRDLMSGKKWIGERFEE